MPPCRFRFRLLRARNSRWRVILQIVIALQVFLLLPMKHLQLQHKSEKEALIDSALGSGSVEELVKPDVDTLVNHNFDFEPVPSPFVVIVVTSLPENGFRRTMIRKTWASTNVAGYGAGARLIFFLGRPQNPDLMVDLIRETEKYQDLVVDDFQESYYALSIKTLRIFKYFLLHHPKSKFLVKTDDDVFVSVPNLVHYCHTKYFEWEAQPPLDLASVVAPFHFVGGVIHEDRGPHTWNTFSKWYAPSGVWERVVSQVISIKSSESGIESEGIIVDSRKYPSYAEGNFYVLSDDAVRDILEASRKVPLYHLEDVYVTGVLATWMLGIKKENVPCVSSASNFFPRWSYRWTSLFVQPKDLIAFHCDDNIELLQTIYDSTKQML